MRAKVEPASTPVRIRTPSDPHAPPVQSSKQRYPQPLSSQSTVLPDAPRHADGPLQHVPRRRFILRNTQLFNSVMRVLSQTRCPTSQPTRDHFFDFERLEFIVADDEQNTEGGGKGNVPNSLLNNMSLLIMNKQLYFLYRIDMGVRFSTQRDARHCYWLRVE